MIGGGFATGREIVEYGAKFGKVGWVSGLGIWLGFTLIAILSFNLVRMFRAYNYKALMRRLVGRGWILYDIFYLIGALLIIAVMASATGEILNQTLGVNYWIGVVLMTLLVSALNYLGDRFITRFKTIGTILLIAAYTAFAVLVLTDRFPEVVSTFSQSATTSESGIFLLWTGILYVGYNLAVFPASFFLIENHRSRKDAIIAGLAAGALMFFPWLLTFFCLMGYAGQEAVMGASVPWLIMLQPYGHLIVVLFGIVIGWTLVETATGMIHAFIHRLEADVINIKNRALTSMEKGVITTGIVTIAIFLAQFGIIDLIATGYRYLAYGMIAVYALPVLIGGVHYWLKKD